jgi:glycosyltransferase involved in cell wall biosynthesis
MEKFDLNGPAAFVIPHWSQGSEMERKWLDETLARIKAQTDPNWVVLIGDGNSPSAEAKDYLRKLEKDYAGKMKIVFMAHSDGPGHARNECIKYANEKKYPFIVFIDADDLTHPWRVEVTRDIFKKNPNVGVVYSTFNIIDENGVPTPYSECSQSIVEILESHSNPPSGKDAWINICTEAGYTNLTSTTSVITQIALNVPFPGEKASEDYYAWLCYSASGAEFAFTPLTPTNYRIPRNTQGSASRSREGGKSKFYETKCRVDAAGVEKAIELATNRGVLDAKKTAEIRAKFYVKEAVTMFREKEMGLAKMCVENALKHNAEIAKKLIAEKGLQSL